VCSVEKYNIAHIVHNYLSGEKIVTACATHHLYAANRIRGPIIVMCSIQSKEEWEEVFHTYTQLKVTVMSGMKYGIRFIIRKWKYSTYSMEFIFGTKQSNDRWRVQCVYYLSISYATTIEL